jgi:CubicO group peptidase (beta-lactamase class C family)
MMQSLSRYALGSVLLVYFLLCDFCHAAEPPITGQANPTFAKLDDVILAQMKLLDATAATVAISRDGKLLYSRGYGWSDEAKKMPTAPDALLRIASVSKPITAAAIKQLIRDKKLSADAKVFSLLDIKSPTGTPHDARVADITVQHLLEHRGGWDREAAFDPMFFQTKVMQELQLQSLPTPRHAIEFMLTQPLQFDPGQKVAYSNFGYCILGRVVEEVAKQNYEQAVEQLVFKPHRIKDIQLGHGAIKQRAPREVWYAVKEHDFLLDWMDSHGGYIASAPALCQFLQHYWLSGTPRNKQDWGDWAFFGSLPGTTAMVRQRRDGYNVAILLNNRRGATYAEDLKTFKKSVDEIFDQLQQPATKP